MQVHVHGSSPDLRRAAEGVLSGLPVGDRLAVALTDPDLDQWARLAACEAVAGSRTEATLRGLARDAKEDAAIRAAAQDMLSALGERGKLLRPAERSLDAEAMTLLRPTWDSPSGDVPNLVRPAEEPTDGDAGAGERRPRGLLSRLRTRKP
jgi:hypothetical protein